MASEDCVERQLDKAEALMASQLRIFGKRRGCETEKRTELETCSYVQGLLEDEHSTHPFRGGLSFNTEKEEKELEITLSGMVFNMVDSMFEHVTEHEKKSERKVDKIIYWVDRKKETMNPRNLRVGFYCFYAE